MERGKELGADAAFTKGRTRGELLLNDRDHVAVFLNADGSDVFPMLEKTKVRIGRRGMVIRGTEVIQYTANTSVQRYPQRWLCKHPGEAVTLTIPGATWTYPGHAPATLELEIRKASTRELDTTGSGLYST